MMWRSSSSSDRARPVRPGGRRTGAAPAATAAAVLGTAVLWASGAAGAPAQKTFATPEAAVRSLIQTVKGGRSGEVFTVLGDQMRDVVSTGDAEQDRRARARFLGTAGQGAYVAADPDHPGDPDRRVVIIGKNKWQFPVPLVKQGNAWRFDGAAGREEVLCRRVGSNELTAIQTVRAYVDAQRDYESQDRMGDGHRQYAMRMHSTPGKHDGLYWSTDHGDDVSPCGVFLADACDEATAGTAVASARAAAPSGQRKSYAGYRYKILTQQGAAAPGGAKSYVVDGRMTGGFAMVAWPVNYGSTGVNTFLVNQSGTVYQKDLGPNTASIARSLTAYNPDSTWKPVSD